MTVEHPHHYTSPSSLRGIPLLAVAGVAFFLPLVGTPGARANPILEQVLISEFRVYPQEAPQIELFFRNVWYPQAWEVEIDGVPFTIRDDLSLPYNGYVILTDTCFTERYLPLMPDGGTIRVSYDQYMADEVVYGSDPGAMVPAPSPGTSASARIAYLPEYDWYDSIDLYLDASPTFGAENDTLGAVGRIVGVVTDSLDGSRVEGAVVTIPEGGSTVTDSMGTYLLHAMSGFRTVIVTADGYRPDTSATHEVTVPPDTTVLHRVVLSRPTGIGDGTDRGPTPPRSAGALAQNRPNPFNPATTIGYAVPGEGPDRLPVRIEIFDLRGRRVRVLIDRPERPGWHEVEWDGRAGSGVPVGSGIYIYRLRSGSFRASRRMVLLR